MSDAARPDDELFPVLAHELRSPVAAILGYQELLAEGTFGDLDARTLDVLHRIRFAALQLSMLIDGMEVLGAGRAASDGPPEPVSAGDLVDRAMDALRLEAQARNIDLRADAGNIMIHTHPIDSCRALTLALGAAIKASPGGTIIVTAESNPVPAILINGSALDSTTDAPGASSVSGRDTPTGPGLRLAFADATARLTGGSVRLEAGKGGTRVRLELPGERTSAD
jgi:two-component system, cell cycle sensor histidine kinase PleC